MLKETSTLKANGRLIVGNTALFQISVESLAMRYQCRQNRVCLSPIFALIFAARRHLVLHDVTKYKMAVHGNSNAKIGDNRNSIFVTLECYFHLVQ